MSRVIRISLVVLCAGVLGASVAHAGHRHGGSYHRNYYSGYGGGYLYQNQAYGPQFISPAPYLQQQYYHDTGHYDWHPTTVTRHRNHYHVSPGHWDYHSTGRWHH